MKDRTLVRGMTEDEDKGEVKKFRLDDVVQVNGFHFKITKLWPNGRMLLKHIPGTAPLPEKLVPGTQVRSCEGCENLSDDEDDVNDCTRPEGEPCPRDLIELARARKKPGP